MTSPSPRSKLTPSGSGGLIVQGDMVFSTAQSLRQQGEDLLSQMDSTITIDLAGVERVGSVGVSVLLCWVRLAESLGKTLQFINEPDYMRDVIRVCGVEPLLFKTP